MSRDFMRKAVIAAALFLSVLFVGCGASDASGDSSNAQQPKAASSQEENTQESGKPETEETGTEKTEVSREDFPDCDGSGHGYTEIHYSDGSVETIEY